MFSYFNMVSRVHWEIIFHCAYQIDPLSFSDNFFLQIVLQFQFSPFSLLWLIPTSIFIIYRPPPTCCHCLYRFNDFITNLHHQQNTLIDPTYPQKFTTNHWATLLHKKCMCSHTPPFLPCVTTSNHSSGYTLHCCSRVFHLVPNPFSIFIYRLQKYDLLLRHNLFLPFMWYFLPLDSHGYSLEFCTKLRWFSQVVFE